MSHLIKNKPLFNSLNMKMVTKEKRIENVSKANVTSLVEKEA